MLAAWFHETEFTRSCTDVMRSHTRFFEFLRNEEREKSMMIREDLWNGPYQST